MVEYETMEYKMGIGFDIKDHRRSVNKNIFDKKIIFNVGYNILKSFKFLIFLNIYVHV